MLEVGQHNFATIEGIREAFYLYLTGQPFKMGRVLDVISFRLRRLNYKASYSGASITIVKRTDEGVRRMMFDFSLSNLFITDVNGKTQVTHTTVDDLINLLDSLEAEAKATNAEGVFSG